MSGNADARRPAVGAERTALALLASLAIASLLVLLHKIWQPAATLLEGPLVDDVFYYLEVAWNYSESGSLSLDGRNITNGFHPLYMGVVLALKPVAGGDKLLFVQLALTSLAVAHVATGVLLSAAFREITPGRPLVAVAPAFVWLLWPQNNLYPLMGLESSLLSAGLAFSLYAFVRLDGSLRRDLVLGTALTITTLARTDALILVPIAGLWIAAPWQDLNPERLKNISLRLVRINSVVVLVIGTYLIANVATFGHAMPISGRVKIVRTLGLEWTPELTALERIQRVSSINLSKRTSPNDQRFKKRTVALLVLLAFEALVATSRRRFQMHSLSRALANGALPQFVPLLLYAIAVHLYYIGIQGYFSSDWYLLHSSLVFSVYAAHWLSKASALVPERPLALLGALALAVFLANEVPTAEAATGPTKPSRFAYDVAMWTNESLEPGTRIGAFNAGVLAYFSHCSVTNLDGLINNAAGEAILEHRLGEYVEAEGLEYLADFGGSVRWSNVFARDNYVKRLYVAVANFGNPTSWKDGGDYVFLKRSDGEGLAVNHD